MEVYLMSIGVITENIPTVIELLSTEGIKTVEELQERDPTQDDLFDYGIVEEADRDAIYYANHPSAEPSGTDESALDSDDLLAILESKSLSHSGSLPEDIEPAAEDDLEDEQEAFLAEMQRRLDLMTEQLKAREEEEAAKSRNTTATPQTATAKPFVNSLGITGPSINANANKTTTLSSNPQSALKPVNREPRPSLGSKAPAKIYPSTTYDKILYQKAYGFLENNRSQDFVALIKDIDVDMQDPDGNTLLHWAVSFNNVVAGKALADKMAQMLPNAAGTENDCIPYEWGKTPVELAMDAVDQGDSSYWNIRALMAQHYQALRAAHQEAAAKKAQEAASKPATTGGTTQPDQAKPASRSKGASSKGKSSTGKEKASSRSKGSASKAGSSDKKSSSRSAKSSSSSAKSGSATKTADASAKPTGTATNEKPTLDKKELEKLEKEKKEREKREKKEQEKKEKEEKKNKDKPPSSPRGKPDDKGKDKPPSSPRGKSEEKKKTDKADKKEKKEKK